MGIDIREDGRSALPAFEDISTAFEVVDVFDVSAKSDGRFVLNRRRADRPYVKDYDAPAGQGPTTWPGRFDLSRWAFFSAFEGSHRVGAATVAYRTPRLEMLEGRRDLALFWDLRVDPARRRHGVGAALFRAVEAWARRQRCSEIKIETQNVNVAACLFYAREGCVLRAANPGVYPDFPDEVQMLWYKDLRGTR